MRLKGLPLGNRRKYFDILGRNDMNQETAVAILTSRDDEKMNGLAQDESCRPDALVVLSQSLNAEIRASVARNASTPKIADEMLAGDADVNVRSEVARKAAIRAADDPDRQSPKLRTAALQILTRMIADQEIRVRQVIAEEIKVSPHVPKEIAISLARDEASSVSGPVLEYSPLLTDNDLIDIITDILHPPALEAIARRKPVSEEVAERLVEILDTEAIATLLRNPDAHIREDGLQKIIDAARTVEEWHEPLTKRPSLSARAIRRICAFVSEGLIKDLAQRPEVDDETRDFISSKVAERLEAENETISDEEAVIDEIRDELLVRMKLGKLNAAYLAEAANSQKHTIVSVALALLADIDHIAVRRAFLTQDAKAITAICWKTKMPMALSRLLQEEVANIAPSDCLEPDDSGGYPLKEGDLEWNFALLAEEGEGPEEDRSAPRSNTRAA